jgi:hypothetical protein
VTLTALLADQLIRQAREDRHTAIPLAVLAGEDL